MIFLFDLDGTLADLSHRIHFIQQKPKDWPSFFRTVVDDAPINDVISILKMIQKDHIVLIVSGRSDECRAATVGWLDMHSIPRDDIYMRKAGDYREDSIVKAEILEEIHKDWGKDIAGVFDDRQQVVNMYRSKGLRVYQVAPGNF